MSDSNKRPHSEIDGDDDDAMPASQRPAPAPVPAPTLAKHPAPAHSLEGLRQAHPAPDVAGIDITIDKDGSAMFNGKRFFVRPMVFGDKKAPADSENKHHPPGEQMAASMYNYQTFGDGNNGIPKANVTIYPCDADVAWFKEFKAKYIKALAAKTIEGGKLPGDWKPKDKKAATALLGDQPKLEAFLHGLADQDEPRINWMVKPCDKASTPTVPVYKMTMKHSPFKQGEPGPTKPGPEYGAEVEAWAESGAAPAKFEGIKPVDLARRPIEYSLLRQGLPDNVPVKFTGMIGELGISGQAVNGNAGGKMFFSMFFAKTLQIVSYSKASAEEGGGGADNTRFFTIDE